MRSIHAFLLLFYFMLPSCGLLSADEPDWSDLQPGMPALWLVENEAGAAYLFGGIHALPKGIKWQTPALERAMTNSDRLVLEVAGLEKDGAVATVFTKLGQTPGQPALSDRVPADLHAKADALQSDTGLADAQMANLESWAAALTFAAASTRHLGISSDHGVEHVLTERYGQAGKPISGLETVEQQLSYFDRLPEDDQREMLRAVIRDADKAESAFRTLLSAWLAGDVKALTNASAKGILSRHNIREAVLVARNAAWANIIEKMVTNDAMPFITVGAAHLAGPDSVQAMLEKRGFRITRIQ